VSGTPGTGVNCTEQWAVCAVFHGNATCIEGSPKKKTNPAVIWGPLVGFILALLAFAVGSWFWRKRKRDREAEDLAPVVVNIQLEHAETSTSGFENIQINVADITPPEVEDVQIQKAENLPCDNESVRTENVKESAPEVVYQPENEEIVVDDYESIHLDNDMELADKI
jgi:hypothetical protein